MALTRLFLDTELRAQASVQLNAEQAHYIGRVLRLQAGATLSVFNGESGEYSAVLSSIGKTAATVMLGNPVPCATESSLRVHLVQGISRGERMDIIVQKATELGVKRITPVFTEFGVVRLAGERAEKRREHWQKVAVSACEQCGRIRPPLIDEPLPLKSWLGSRNTAGTMDLILRPGAAQALAALPAPETKVCLLIGPEGGFSATEYEDAGVAGFMPVSLGPRILRTETAALAAITVAASMWGDLGPN